MVHGTLGAYNNEKCRCDKCKKVKADYMRWWRSNKPKPFADEAEVWGFKHGTTTGYRNGCRCDRCRWAINVYQRVRNGGTAPKQPGKFKVTPSTSGGNKHD